MPFFVVMAPRPAAEGRVQVYATAFPSSEAAAAHALQLDGPTVVIEAMSLQQAIDQVRGGAIW